MTRLGSAFVGAALLFGLGVAPVLAQNSPAGTWEVVVDTPLGAQQMTMTVAVNGERADGTFGGALGTLPITGTAKTDSIEMTGALEIQGMSLQLAISGRAAGDALSGKIKLGDFGEFPLTGKRAAPTAASAASPAATPAVATSSVAGKWNVTVAIAGMGEVPMTATLSQTGEIVTGTVGALGARDVPVEGTFSGTSLAMEFTVETPQGVFVVTLTGELSATGLAGKADIAGLADAEWKAVRGQ